MSIYQPESFYSTTLASAITASQNTIPVTVAPNITAGYLVLEANTSNREIIKYTGVTGTTLTGVVRGLASYGSDDSAGTGKAHSAGVDIANKDVHFYYAQYYDFLTGVSSTGANALRHGDGNTISADNRFWYVNTSSLSAFWGLSSSGKLVCSEDGVTSYVISAGGSGVTGGTGGIDITAGAVTVTYLSSGGLRISSDKLAVNYDGTALKGTSAGELYFDKTIANIWGGNNTFTGIVSLSSVNAASASFTNLPTAAGLTPTSGSELTTMSYVDDQDKKVLVLIASDDLVASADTERNTSSTAYIKVKEIQIKHKGTVRVKFDMKGYAARTVYGQIYKNGSAHGSERNLFNDTNYTTYSEDLVFADGDLIQLYYKADSASEVYIKNFRLYFTKGFETTLYTVNTD